MRGNWLLDYKPPDGTDMPDTSADETAEMRWVIYSVDGQHEVIVADTARKALETWIAGHPTLRIAGEGGPYEHNVRWRYPGAPTIGTRLSEYEAYALGTISIPHDQAGQPAESKRENGQARQPGCRTFGIRVHCILESEVCWKIASSTTPCGYTDLSSNWTVVNAWDDRELFAEISDLSADGIAFCEVGATELKGDQHPSTNDAAVPTDVRAFRTSTDEVFWARRY